MGDSDDKNSAELPAPEVLQPHGEKKESEKPTPSADGKKGDKASKNKPRRTTYRPSHKATFIGLAVIGGVLAINAIVIFIVLSLQNNQEEPVNRTEVTLSTETLDGLGVSRTPIGDLGTELTIGPDAQFNGDVVVSGNTTIAGSLTLNSTFSAAGASFTQLQGGETSLTSLNVNQDTSTSTLNVRDQLVSEGTTLLQGTVTVSQLLTVNNNLNVTGSLSVGGTLTVQSLQVSSLTVNSNITIGGHFITAGSAPSVSAGGAVGSNGTVSISGNDASGTVAVNIGVGGGNGTLASVSFRNVYSSTPHVVISPVGRSPGNFYINRSANGFSIHTDSSLSPGGYAFDYIVMQ